MPETLSSGFRRALGAWVALARRGAVAVVAAALALTVGFAFYTADNLGMNTSTEDMLAQELPFRQQKQAFDAAFPQLTGNAVIVIDGANADLAEDGAAALSERLRARPDLFNAVYAPGADPFFKQNGLLYLDLDELDDLADRLADAQALLTDLAEDPSLRGFLAVLIEALDEILDGEEVAGGLDAVFERLALSLEARSRGEPGPLSWLELMRDQEGSVDERRRFIVVDPVLDFASLQPAAKALAAIRASAAELGLTPEAGVRLRLTGSAALRHEEFASVRQGAGSAGLISLVLVSGLLFWGLGSARLVAATLLTLLAGLAWTAAFAAFAIGHLNLISVAFAVLFIGLGVDFGIHFVLRYREEIERGQGHAEALRGAAQGVGGALSLSAAAAAIGFLSFLPTAFVGVSELGLISGAGMFIALFMSLTLLPALLTLMPLKSGAAGPAGAAARRFEHLIGHHARTIIRGAVALGVIALAALPFARFDFDPLNLRDPTTESMQTLYDLQRESDRPLYSIEILAADLDQAAALAGRLEALDEVDEALTLHDFIPEDQAEKLEIVDDMALYLSALLVPPDETPAPSDDQRRAALAEFRAKLEAALRHALEEPLAGAARRLAAAFDAFEAGPGFGPEALAGLETALVGSLPTRLEDLRLSLEPDEVTLDDLPRDLVGRRLAADGRARVEVMPEEDIAEPEALRRFVAAVRGIAPGATASPVIILEAGRAVVGAFQQATLTALVLILGLLFALLRSARDSAFVLAPLLLAGLLTVATTVALGIPFNFANVIVLPLLLGLGVASGIHLMLRYRGDGEGQGLLRTSTPRAVLFSALTTVGSFGSLAISSHRGTASMGLLLTIALLYTLVCSLVVLPAMLARRGAEPGR